jgi:hypothetical protein
VQTVPPTAGPLAACPHCGARVAKPTGPVRFEYGVGVVGNQRCDRCGANWRYHWQEGGPRRQRGFLFPALVVLVVAALVVGAIALASSREPDFPSTWNARIRPIVARVEALRDLSFQHPVKVNFLAPSDFESRLAADSGDRAERRRRAERTAALMRAAGLLGADVDLARAERSTRVGDIVAFYDDDTKQIYVRGTGPLTVDQRVTLAHELTHVLQDQVFDLNRLSKRAETSNAGSLDALEALVEGDAARVQDLFLAGLSQSERDEYALRSLAAQTAARARTARTPAVVSAVFGAPHVFGAPVTQVLAAGGGNASVDAALDGPPPSTHIYFDPAAVKQAPQIPPVPEVLDDEKQLPELADGDDHFDNLTFYLMLAAKFDLPTALRAADAFSTGSQVAYTRGGRTCFRAAIDGVTRASSRYLSEVLGRWAATMPQAGVSFTATGVLLHSCDPGEGAIAPDDARIQRAVRVAAGRDELVAALARQPLPVGLAVCAARVLVRQPDFREAILSGAGFDRPTPQMVQASTDAGRTCRADPKAGVP